jgi:riboflavin kinase/FMN adenylyltransferase
VTIGTFDGVHLGHQELVRRTVERAREERLRALAVTFEPPPQLVLRPETFPGRLCTPAERDAALLAAGADGVVVVPFTRNTAALSPESFVGRLVELAGLRLLVVGEDFALGRGRAGDVARLREIGAREEMAFAVEAIGRIGLGPETAQLDRDQGGGTGGQRGDGASPPRPALPHLRRGDPRQETRPHHRIPDGQRGASGRPRATGRRHLCLLGLAAG